MAAKLQPLIHPTWRTLSILLFSFLSAALSGRKAASVHRNIGSINLLNSNAEERKRLSFIPDGLKNAIASGLATAVVKTFLQPLDTIKTIQQAQKIKLGPIKAAMQIIEQRGVRGLWSGIGITVVGSTPSVAVYFGVYSTMKTNLVRAFPQELKLLAVALSAAVGNTFASVLRVPYEVLKQRIQTGRHQSAWEAVVYSWKNDGPLGLFDKGKLSSQIVRDVPYAIVTLVSYEILQNLVARAMKRKEKNADEKTTLESRNSRNKNSLLVFQIIPFYLHKHCKVTSLTMMTTKKMTTTTMTMMTIILEWSIMLLFMMEEKTLLLQSICPDYQLV